MTLIFKMCTVITCLSPALTFGQVFPFSNLGQYVLDSQSRESSLIAITERPLNYEKSAAENTYITNAPPQDTNSQDEQAKFEIKALSEILVAPQNVPAITYGPVYSQAPLIPVALPPVPELELHPPQEDGYRSKEPFQIIPTPSNPPKQVVLKPVKAPGGQVYPKKYIPKDNELKKNKGKAKEHYEAKVQLNKQNLHQVEATQQAASFKNIKARPTFNEQQSAESVFHDKSLASFSGHDVSGGGTGVRTEFQMHGQQGPKSYKFGFDTGDRHNRQFRYEERDPHGLVRGHYGFYDKSGKLNVVNYHADPISGYHAEPAILNSY